MDRRELLPFGQAFENLPGNFRQHRVRQNIVHIAVAAFDLGTAARHFVHQPFVMGQRNLVSLLNAALNLANLEAHNLF